VENQLPLRAAPADTDSEWRYAARCRHADPELFFPAGTAGPALRQEALAKRICADCPVRMPCLRWALRHGVEFGIWGGIDERQRREMRGSQIRRELATRGNPVTGFR
jgi:WhiB family transcriptional regulator, redox-sensing transcriptional regulator